MGSDHHWTRPHRARSRQGEEHRPEQGVLDDYSGGVPHRRSYQDLFEKNRTWVDQRRATDPGFFDRLAAGQQPRFLFIGCSDSRVNANEITGSQPGDLFVHRNVANLVVPTDMNLMSVLQYAIEVLHVEHVIVCGHFGCGGVLAAVDGHHHGLIDGWLAGIKDVYRRYRVELEAIEDPEMRHRRLVERNVEEQVFKLCATEVVQRTWPEDYADHVHGWVYDIHDGLLRDLCVNPRLDEGLGIYLDDQVLGPC